MARQQILFQQTLLIPRADYKQMQCLQLLFPTLEQPFFWRLVFLICITIVYYMAGVCSQYNARSDWLSAASRQGIILP